MGEEKELVAVTVKLPKKVLEFYKAVFVFEGESEDGLPEYLGYEITSSLEGHFSSNLETLLDLDRLKKNCGF